MRGVNIGGRPRRREQLMCVSGVGVVWGGVVVRRWNDVAVTSVVVADIVVVRRYVVVNDANLVVIAVADVTVSWPRPSVADSAHLTLTLRRRRFLVRHLLLLMLQALQTPANINQSIHHDVTRRRYSLHMTSFFCLFGPILKRNFLITYSRPY